MAYGLFINAMEKKDLKSEFVKEMINSDGCWLKFCNFFGFNLDKKYVDKYGDLYDKFFTKAKKDPYLNNVEVKKGTESTNLKEKQELIPENFQDKKLEKMDNEKKVFIKNFDVNNGEDDILFTHDFSKGKYAYLLQNILERLEKQQPEVIKKNPEILNDKILNDRKIEELEKKLNSLKLANIESKELIQHPILNPLQDQPKDKDPLQDQPKIEDKKVEENHQAKI